MNFTEQEKNDFISQITEALKNDKGFGEAIKKINVGNTAIDTKNLSKEERTAKFFNALVHGDKKSAEILSGTEAAGLVPKEFHADVINNIEKNPLALRNLTTVMPVNARSGEIPTIETNGIILQWGDSDSETDTEKSKKFDLQNVEYTVHRLEAYTAIAKDTLADSPIAIYKLLLELYTEALITAENAAILRGTGSRQPKGILTDAEPALITEENLDELISLQYAIPASKRNNAVYVASSVGVNKMRLIKDTTGRYLWENGNMANGELPTFNGFKVVEVDAIDEEEKNVILFGNFKDYYIFDRGELAVDTNTASDAAFFGNTAILRLQTRLDGKLVNTKAFKSVYFAVEE